MIILLRLEVFQKRSRQLPHCYSRLQLCPNSAGCGRWLSLKRAAFSSARPPAVRGVRSLRRAYLARACFKGGHERRLRVAPSVGSNSGVKIQMVLDHDIIIMHPRAFL